MITEYQLVVLYVIGGALLAALWPCLTYRRRRWLIYRKHCAYYNGKHDPMQCALGGACRMKYCPQQTQNKRDKNV